MQPEIRPRNAAAAALLGFVALGSMSTGLRAADSDPGLVQRGEYLMRAGDCIACHTAPGGKPFAGGLAMETPFGTISTPNITPDKATGIGDWSDDDFYRAMHEGIGHKGEYLYPVFPFPWYTKVTREDVLAIKAYLFSLEPVNSPRKPLQFAFPFNIREALPVLAHSLLQTRHVRARIPPKAPRSIGVPIWSRGWAIAENATMATMRWVRQTGAAS